MEIKSTIKSFIPYTLSNYPKIENEELFLNEARNLYFEAIFLNLKRRGVEFSIDEEIAKIRNLYGVKS